MPLANVPSVQPSAVVEEAAEGDTMEQYTKYTNYTPVKAEPVGFSSTDSNVLVAYFSRAGNTAIPAGVDAVSSASLNIHGDGNAAGNAEQMAAWIAEETGGDLFLIQTEYTYPVDYDQTVQVGEGQDRDNYHPTLITHIENMDQYDTVYLVFPIWHYTLPVPVCSFLEEYDLSGKTVKVFTTHAGSRFANAIDRIKTAEPGADVSVGIAVSQNQTESAKQDVIALLRADSQQTSENLPSIRPDIINETTTAPGSQETEEQTEMKLKIGNKEVAVRWENNTSVDALKKLVSDSPLIISMSMYGGFEQVGSIGASLIRSDVQTVTSSGDIVLYSGNQIVIFYGSNSWAYTRLGHITDQSAAEMADLLAHGNVTITIYH